MKLEAFDLTPRKGGFESGKFPGKVVNSLYDLSVAAGFLELAAYPKGYKNESGKMIKVIVSKIDSMTAAAKQLIHKTQMSDEMNSKNLDDMNLHIQDALHTLLDDSSLWPMPIKQVETTIAVPDNLLNTLTAIVTFMRDMGPNVTNSNKVSDNDALEQLESDLKAFEQFGDIGCSTLIKRVTSGKAVSGTLVTGILRMRNMGKDESDIKEWVRSKSNKAASELLNKALSDATALSTKDSDGQLSAQEKNISILVWLLVVGVLGGYNADGSAIDDTQTLENDLMSFCSIMRKCIMKDRAKRRMIIESSGSSFTKRVWSMARKSLVLNCCTMILSETRMVQTCCVTGLGTALSNIRNVKADKYFVAFLCEMWSAIDMLPDDRRLKKEDFRVQVVSLLQHSLVSAGNCFTFSIKMTGRASDVRIISGN